MELMEKLHPDIQMAKDRCKDIERLQMLIGVDVYVYIYIYTYIYVCICGGDLYVSFRAGFCP